MSGAFVWDGYYLNCFDPVEVYEVIQIIASKKSGVVFERDFHLLRKEVFEGSKIQKECAFLSYDKFLGRLELSFSYNLKDGVLYPNPNCINYLVPREHFIEIVTSGGFESFESVEQKNKIDQRNFVKWKSGEEEKFNEWTKMNVAIPPDKNTGFPGYTGQRVFEHNGTFSFADVNSGHFMHGFSLEDIKMFYLQDKKR